MKTTEPQNKKHFTQYIVTFVFLAFLFGMAILFVVLPKKAYSSNEKRYLAETPQFSFEALIMVSLLTIQKAILPIIFLLGIFM